MTNPVSLNQSAQQPPPNTPIVDPATGIPTPQYHRFENVLVSRTGGPAGIDLASVEATAEQALATANGAEALAQTADNTANAANVNASHAQTTANTANTNANNAFATAQSAIAGSLRAINNLSDVASVQSARVNLGVDLYPVVIQIQDPTSSVGHFVPLLANVTIPANFQFTLAYCGVVPTADATFSLSYIRGGVSNFIGTITLIHGGPFFALSNQPAVSLVYGDVLMVSCPSDATLAQVGLSIYTVLS